DRDVEDVRRVLVAEVADVDENDHVAEVVRDRCERRDDVVLRQPFHDALLVGRGAVGLGELVVEVVVVRLERRGLRRTLPATATIAPAILPLSTPGGRLLFPSCYAATISRNPAFAIASSSVSRVVWSSSHASVTWPIRVAFAASRPSSPVSAPASRATQRSQRM